MRITAFSLLALLLCGGACAEPASRLRELSFGAKGLIVPIYLGSDLKPSAVVRVKEVRKDYESKGFFRMGLLPIAVLDGVVFEIRQPESLASSLAACHQWLGARSAKRAELRDVQWVLGGSTTNRLACARAQLTDTGRWNLSGGVSLVSGTNRLESARAVLQVTGPNAGQLVMGAAPSCTHHLGAPVASSSERP